MPTRRGRTDRAVQGDPELLPNRAVPAVGGDEKTGANVPLDPVRRSCRTAVIPASSSCQDVSSVEKRMSAPSFALARSTARACPGRSDRTGWAEGRHVCAIFLFFGRLMLAGQRLRPYPDPAEVIAGEARRPDTWLKPDLPEQLDGALGEAACPWVDQQVGVLLDQQRLDAVLYQEERHR